MKPREFDELIRQKFDQGAFEYNPASWDRLNDQLEGRSKKRTLVLWWWMPLAGIAASVALAVGIPSLWHFYVPVVQPTIAQHTPSLRSEKPMVGIVYTEVHKSAPAITRNTPSAQLPARKAKRQKNIPQTTEKEYAFGISLDNALGSNTPEIKKGVPSPELNAAASLTTKTSKKSAATVAAQSTFNPDETPKTPKVTVTLIGGIAQGSMNSGYMAGATVRRMLNDRVFVESDVAYESSNNSQTTYLAPSAARHSGARVTSTQSGKTTYNPDGQSASPVARDETYNLAYAQVTPSVGVKLMSRMTLAAGPDFQQALADNRPTPSTTLDRNNIAVAPLFDVGMVAKSELAVTKKLKAGVSYRKGINNLLTPMDKFIDRDYLQVQLRCTILNR